MSLLGGTVTAAHIVQTVPVLEPMTRAESLDRLRGHHFGRLAVVVGDQPTIFPVNYALDGDTITVRTDLGSGIDASVLKRVAFEVDQVDAESREGWSVVVQGVARDVSDAIDGFSERTRALSLLPWAPGLKPKWIKIVDPTVNGRRLTQRPTAC